MDILLMKMQYVSDTQLQYPMAVYLRPMHDFFFSFSPPIHPITKSSYHLIRRLFIQL